MAPRSTTPSVSRPQQTEHVAARERRPSPHVNPNHIMKSIVAFLIALLASTAQAASASRLRIAPQVTSGLTIEIAEAASGAPMLGVTPQQRILDLGLLASYGVGTPAPNVTITQTGDRIIASTDFVLKVTGTSVSGSAHIVSSVTGIDPAYVIRIDGIQLTSVPIIVRPPAALETTSIHRMAIDTPTATPATQPLSNEVFQAM